MQRERVALVLEDDAGASLRDGGKLPLHGGIEGRQPRRFRRGAGARAQLGAVTPDRRQLQGEKMRSSSLSGRPLTKATPPSVRRQSRASVSRSSCDTKTS